MLKMQLFECENTCESRPHEDSGPTHRAVRYNKCFGFQIPTNETPFRWSGAALLISYETAFSSGQQVDNFIETVNHAFDEIIAV